MLPHLPLPLFIIGDFAKDLDDEFALIVAVALHRAGQINLLGVIGNLAPADLRARVAKGTLTALGLKDMPVAVGLPVYEGLIHAYEMDIPYLAPAAAVQPDGQALLRETLVQAAQPVTLILQSALSDFALFLQHDAALAAEKIANICLMGGVETALRDGFAFPNNASNNSYDMPAALYVHRRIQELGIPLTITTRNAAYATQMPFALYRVMEMTGHVVAAGLARRQAPSMQRLWEAACAPLDSPMRGSLPADRDRGWYMRTYCGGVDPSFPESGDIWPFLKGFSLFDPINLLAALPNLKTRFFDAVRLAPDCPVEVIGLNPKQNGVKSPDALRAFLQETILSDLS